MGASTPLFYRHEKHAKTQPRVLEFNFKLTGTNQAAAMPAGAGVLASFGAITQAQIDAYLSDNDYTSTVLNGFVADRFDATAMGTDAFAGIVNMNGQAAAVISAEYELISGTNLNTVVAAGALGDAGLTAGALENAVGISPRGDIAFKLVLAGLDAAATAARGILNVKIKWISK